VERVVLLLTGGFLAALGGFLSVRLEHYYRKRAEEKQIKQQKNALYSECENIIAHCKAIMPKLAELKEKMKDEQMEANPFTPPETEVYKYAMPSLYPHLSREERNALHFAYTHLDYIHFFIRDYWKSYRDEMQYLTEGVAFANLITRYVFYLEDCHNRCMEIQDLLTSFINMK